MLDWPTWSDCSALGATLVGFANLIAAQEFAERRVTLDLAGVRALGIIG